MKSMHAIAKVMGRDDGDGRNARLRWHALELVKDGTEEDRDTDVVSGQKLLYNICSFGLRNLGFNRKEYLVIHCHI